MLEINTKLLKNNSQPREKMTKRALHVTEFHHQNSMQVLSHCLLKLQTPAIKITCNVCWLELHLNIESRGLKDRSFKGQHRNSSQRIDLMCTGFFSVTAPLASGKKKKAQSGLNTTQCSLYSRYVLNYQALKQI